MLPQMTVEQRESETAHGLNPPPSVRSKEFKRQLSDMLMLCQGAKSSANRQEPDAWPAEVLGILHDYSPFEVSNIPPTLKKFGFGSWAEAVEFVMDDECVEFWLLVCKYAKAEKLDFQKDRDFIDGAGTGIYRRYLRALSNKGEGERGSLEKAFDAKYHFRYERPLVHLTEEFGEDAACLVNYVHPGHWSYPAGHGAKFFTAVKVARETWDLEGREEVNDTEILTAAYVLAMARSGGGVHFPIDNIASGYLSGLPEFAEYGAE